MLMVWVMCNSPRGDALECDWVLYGFEWELWLFSLAPLDSEGFPSM